MIHIPSKIDHRPIKQFYLSMSQIKHFQVNEILRKRASNKQPQRSALKTGPHPVQKAETDINLDQVLYSAINLIKENGVEAISAATMSQLIEIMASKSDSSLNLENILAKAKLKQSKYLQIVQKNNFPSQQAMLKVAKKVEESQKVKNCYFVLSGSISLYTESRKQPSRTEMYSNDFFSNESIFLNEKQLLEEYPKFEKSSTITELNGLGFLFQKEKKNCTEGQTSNGKVSIVQQEERIVSQTPETATNKKMKKVEIILAENTIFLEISAPDYQNEFINSNGISFEKIEGILQSSNLFAPLGKRIKSISQFFTHSVFKYGQKIYSKDDQVNKFYFLVNGEVVFEHTPTNSLKNKRKSVSISEKLQKTQAITSGEYFGQEQILNKIPVRILTARCNSRKCQILEIQRQKFQRVLENVQFYDGLKRTAEIKLSQRKHKIQRNATVKSKFNIDQNVEESPFGDSFLNYNVERQSSSNTKRKNQTINGSEGLKIMHGNVIRQFTKSLKEKNTEDVEFSMLGVNPDMYQKTVNKFRKFNIKPAEKYKANLNWDLKRIWKVLNLENVLREDVQIGNPEGRKFYDNHKRYVHQVTESKSLRPKTTSSSYRTKLQYVAYLQQFKNEDLPRIG